jgi:23S rRNA (guanosine2251-2'-O)-methyltransferase
MEVYPVSDQIEGRNPVLEAIKSGRSINKLLVARGQTEGSIRQIISLARAAGIVIQEVDRSKLDQMATSHAHQGVIALVPPYKYAEVDDILARARDKGEDGLILLLDGIEDPMNLGNLIRSADAVGAHGVIIPERRAAGVTATVAKASAGAVAHVPVARVTNLVRTVEDLKKQGFWVVGTHQNAKELYYQARLTGPLVVVVGSEGQGISRLLTEHCDFMVRLPMRGNVTSLNAAVAGGVLLYEVRRQRDIINS